VEANSKNAVIFQWNVFLAGTFAPS